MPNTKSARPAHVRVVGVLVLTVAFMFLSPATLLDVGVGVRAQATEFRPPENGPVVRVVVLDDRNAVGIEFTPDASAVIKTMTCEQQVLYADTILAVWSLPKRDPTASIALWRHDDTPIWNGPDVDLSCSPEGLHTAIRARIRP